jgi:hypothetical protein
MTMHHDDYQALKAAQAQQARGVMGLDGRTVSNEDNCLNKAQTPYRPPSMREQAEKSVGYHRSEAEKHDRALAFFRENPAFDEFIQLVRSGAIQF